MKKLSKAERRAQLLKTAHALVCEQGTDALTLGSLANAAGVSKPITYEHFQSRSGLMIALYQQLNERRLQEVSAVLDATPTNLGSMARAMAHAYMACHGAMGPEFHAIGAALKGDPCMHACQQKIIDGYVDFFHTAFAPLSPLPHDTVRRRCVGIIGAAEALSDAMVRGHLNKGIATDDLAALIECWLVHSAKPAECPRC